LGLNVDDAQPGLRLGLLGGTFDPPHLGHLVLARSAAVALDLDRVILLPSGKPWQKVQLSTPAQTRVELVRAAIASVIKGPDERWTLELDDRETRRAGLTYTADTLQELRAEWGPRVQLVWLMGADQFRNLPTWHRWRELLEYAHLAVTARGPEGLEHLPAVLENLLATRGRDALPPRSENAFGNIVFFRMPPVPVSSSELRRQLQLGLRPAELIPSAVLHLIERHGLYL